MRERSYLFLKSKRRVVRDEARRSGFLDALRRRRESRTLVVVLVRRRDHELVVAVRTELIVLRERRQVFAKKRLALLAEEREHEAALKGMALHLVVALDGVEPLLAARREERDLRVLQIPTRL